MRKIYDPMEYQPNMQQIDSDIFDHVIAARTAYQPEQYTAKQVQAALRKDVLSFEDFAALLSPAAQPFLEQMARRAKEEREKHFGNNVLLFTPLYISNYCENQCVYCGFNSAVSGVQDKVTALLSFRSPRTFHRGKAREKLGKQGIDATRPRAVSLLMIFLIGNRRSGS